MATRVFADEQLERLREFPEIGREELFRFFTMSPADVAFVDPGRGRGPADRLGLAIALCTLPWLGFVPDRLVTAPPVAVERLAGQLGWVGPVEIGSYGRRAQTRTEHVRLVARYLGWRNAGAMELLIAVHMLLELNATGARKVPAEAPTGFVPTKWRGYLDEARKPGSATAYRHYWELCVLLGLRDGLRSGDVFVPGSRRYADPAAYLLTAEQWEPQRVEFCRLVGKSADPA
nr:DUF4158 domain-containing protein [Nocardia brasiliensis]